MAHELDINGGIASFASARTHAWHRLGQVLPDSMTAEDALSAANLAGWNVRKVPEYAQLDPTITDEGVTPGAQLVTGKFSTIRTNPVTGGVNLLGSGLGEGYTVIQNEENADILNALVDESGAHFETAGALQGGRKVFLTMKLPRSIELAGSGGTDVTNLYLVAENSHDGSSAFRVMVTPVRVVCANTLRAALGRATSQYSIRHTANASKNLQAVREALGMTWRYVDTFESELEKMIHADLRPSDATKKLRKVFRFDQEPGTVTDRTEKNQNERIDHVMKLWTSSDTLDGFHGSRYGLYQAVAEWADHFSPVYGKGDPAEMRAERIAKGGEMQRVKESAFNLLAV